MAHIGRGDDHRPAGRRIATSRGRLCWRLGVVAVAAAAVFGIETLAACDGATTAPAVIPHPASTAVTTRPSPAPITTQPSPSATVPLRPVPSAAVTPPAFPAPFLEPAPPGTPVGHCSLRHIGTAMSHWHGHPVAYLTFDDGPDPTYTPEVLSVLRTYGVHATFFDIGENAAWFPSLVRRELAGGDLVGDHTWDHVYALSQTSSRIARQELLRGQEEITAVAGVTPGVWRPPFLSYDSRVAGIAQRMGMTMCSSAVDSEDYTLPGVGAIVHNVLSVLQPGDIILQHDGGGYTRQETVDAIRRYIPILLKQGWVFGVLEPGPAPHRIPAHLPGETTTGAAAPDGIPATSTLWSAPPARLQASPAPTASQSGPPASAPSLAG